MKEDIGNWMNLCSLDDFWIHFDKLDVGFQIHSSNMNIVLVVLLQTKLVEPVTLELQSENCIRFKFNLQLPCFKDWKMNFAKKRNLIIRRSGSIVLNMWIFSAKVMSDECFKIGFYWSFESFHCAYACSF